MINHYENLGNGIILFKNVLKEPDKVYDFIKKSKESDDQYFGKKVWSSWMPWGNYAKAYPMNDLSYLKSNDYGAQIQKEGLEIFFNALSVYKKNFLDNYYFEKFEYDKNIPTNMNELIMSKKYTMSDFVLFETNRNSHKHAQMEWHQDIRYHWGTYNHVLNFNIYINDDYNGGEIVFFQHRDCESVDYIDSITKEKGKCLIVKDFFEYKMQAGDAMLFDTEIFHAVNILEDNKSKYYIRQFLTHSPSEKYHIEKQKYLDQGFAEKDFEDFIKKEELYLRNNRPTPVLFNDINNISLSHISEDLRHNFFPVIVK